MPEGKELEKENLTPSVVAIKAGRKLADRVFGGQKDSYLEYVNIPTVVFAHPTCGSIGLSEEEARAKYGNVKIYASKFTNLYYALLQRKQATAYKLIVTGPNEKVVGLHLFGMGSDEILQGFGVAIRKFYSGRHTFKTTDQIYRHGSHQGRF